MTGEFSVRNGFGVSYRHNIVYPMNPGHAISPDQKWSMTCDKMLSASSVYQGGQQGGVYQGTYDKERNKIVLIATDIKGNATTIKCEMFSHDWRQPGR